MTEHRGIDPDRMGELVDGATPAGDDERALVALMQETRDLEPGAPDDLRARILEQARAAAATTDDRSSWRVRALDPRRWVGGDGAERRRRLLVAAPVTAAIVVALAVALPSIDSGGDSDSTSPPEAASSQVAPAKSARAATPPADAFESAPASSVPVVPDRDRTTGDVPAIASPSPGPVPAAGRLQNVEATTRVQVEDVNALSSASTRAMSTVRGLGGYTASSDYGVPDGGRGTNVLVFRVPTARVEQALTAFGRLGVVLAQDADIVDVTDRVAAADRGVTRLRVRLADLRARAAADPADAALATLVVRTEAALDRAEASAAAQKTRARLAIVRLTLTTEGPPPAAGEENEFLAPISDAGDRLAGGLAWLLGAIVLLGPVAALLALAVAVGRRVRGRSARRLMGSA